MGRESYLLNHCHTAGFRAWQTIPDMRIEGVCIVKWGGKKTNSEFLLISRSDYIIWNSMCLCYEGVSAEKESWMFLSRQPPSLTISIT